jgi:diacylglycerol kinase family enzyme
LSLSPARGAAGAPVAAGEICLLINPLSCRTLYGSLAKRAREMAEAAGLEVVVTGDPQQILALLRRLHARRAPQLFVLSGDGTIQLIANYLVQLPPGEWNPGLLLLGGGRANVVPRAHGGDPALPALRAALQAVREGRPLTLESQTLLRVEQEGAPPRHGVVLAGSVADFGIRHCRAYRASGKGWWHRGLLADPWCVLMLVVQTLIGLKPVPPSPQLDVTLDTGERMVARVRVLMAATLVRAGGHYNPYAERGSGPLRVTAVAADARRFWRNLPRVLSGKYDFDHMNTLQGYLSGRCHTMHIHGLSGYSLDGEPVDVDPQRPLRLTTGMDLNILRP